MFSRVSSPQSNKKAIRRNKGISNTILLATDGSVPALVATIQATEMARDRKAKLIVLT